MRQQSAVMDHILAVTLKTGAYTAFALVAVGVVLRLLSPYGQKILTAGILVLLATPVLRIVVAGIEFLRERDRKYALVSFGVLCIVAIAYWLGIQA